MTPPSGLAVIDKPGGLTSHDVVSRARRILGTRKVGHAGTLDPMATGVLILGVGPGTRLLGHLALRDKEYAATIRLGAATVTDDAEGEQISAADPDLLAAVTDDRIRDALGGFRGRIRQRPSAVSAIKVDGQRAYARVRAGQDVTLPEREVLVDRLSILGVARGPAAVDVRVELSCSTGTYVRAIARDLGDLLGVGGHLTALRRTRVGPFTVGSAVGLDDLDARGPTALIGLDQVGLRCFPGWTVPSEQAEAVRHGRPIAWGAPRPGPEQVPGPVAIMGEDGELLALAHDQGGWARYDAVLAVRP